MPALRQHQRIVRPIPESPAVIFLHPIPFEQALKTSKAKLVLQTPVVQGLSTKELEAFGPALRRRALVLAKQENAQLAAACKGIVEDILEGRETQEGGRHKLSQWFDATGYQPDEGKAGGIEDLGSSARMNLILRTETQLATGYGEWKQGQTNTLVNMWPAQELFRAESRVEERDWPERWRSAGGQFFEGAGDGGPGRMIALKDDPIWRTISRFDSPWAPFDFNSGMDVRDIDREEAEFLGLIAPGTLAIPQRDVFADKVPFPADLPEDIRRELERELANERHNGGRPTQRGGSAPYPRPSQELVDRMLTKAKELNALTFEPLLRVLDIARLQPSQWADKEPVPGLADAVREDPASVPPLLVQVWGNGVFRVLDGHHRLKAARQAGRSTVWCVVIDAGYLA